MANRNTRRNRVKVKTGKENPINSSQARKNSGRQPYEAPTARVHSRSGLSGEELRNMLS